MVHSTELLNLLLDLKSALNLTYIFISHNLAVVHYLADRIAVMCAGRLVEIAPRRELFAKPGHPYTRALLASAPSPDLEHRLDFNVIRDGAATNPANWPAPFDEQPGSANHLVEVGPGHFVRARAEAKIKELV